MPAVGERETEIRAGLGARLVSLGLSILLASLTMAVWNSAQAIVLGRAYRQDPSRALELFALAVVLYVPLVALPAVLLAVMAAVAARRARPDPANRRRRSLLSLSAGPAAGSAALLFVLGVMAQRDPPELATVASIALDLVVAAAASIAVAFASPILVGATERRVRRLGLAAGSLPLSLVYWEIARDRIGGGSGAPVKILLALVSLAAAVATLLALAWLLSRAAGSARTRRVAGFLLVAGAASLAAAVLRPDRGSEWAHAAPPAPGDRPNIVLVVADTLRADRVGARDGGGPRTPAIDAIGERGARFELVYSSSAWTAPATASIFTGLNPGVHGLMTYRDVLREDAVSLATVLEEAGYATAGFSANPILSARYGFGAGFGVWDEEIDPSRLQRHRRSPLYATLTLLGLWRPPDHFPRAERVVDRGIEWIDAQRGRPFLLYLHLMDAHDPYAPPGPYDAARPGAPASGFRMEIGTLASVMNGETAVSRADFDRMRGLYDGAVEYIDAQVGRLREALSARGLEGSTLLVFTADHGEEFIEHGDLEHTRSLYEEIVRIPLVMAGPGVRAGTLLRGPVRQVDLAPTILEAAGSSFRGKIEGASLWGAVSRGEALEPRPVPLELIYMGFRSPWHFVAALREGDLKLIGSCLDAAGNGPWTWTLHDLAADPRETADVAISRPEETAAMRGRIEAWLRRPRAARAPGRPYDEETERRLRSLGYID